MKNILIVGCGKLGSSLYRVLKEKALYQINSIDPEKSCTENMHPQLSAELVSLAQVIFVCVPDEAIKNVASTLTQFTLTDKVIVHTSGAHPAKLLESLKKIGAHTGSFHPIQTFANHFSEPTVWKNIWCTFEGSSAAGDIVKYICDKIGSQFKTVNANQKKALHIAAVFAANYSVALYAATEKILQENNLDKHLILPLIQQVQQNFEIQSAHKILSGPIQRGDSKTVSEHLDYLSENSFNPEHTLYLDLANYLLSDPEFNIHNREKLLKVLKRK